jgi:hypothetical protein
LEKGCWGNVVYPKPGDSSVHQKERRRIKRLEDQKQNLYSYEKTRQLHDPNYVNNSDNDNLLQENTKWKNRPAQLMSQDNLPDIDEISDINHPLFAAIFLKSVENAIEE